MKAVDFIVVGAGIAGISAACELSKQGRVAVLEQEPYAAYHATGRSAAMFLDSYGGPGVHALTVASRAFLDAPDCGGSEGSLLKRRGLMYVARAGEESLLADRGRYDLDKLLRLDAASVQSRIPIMKRDAIAGALFEPSAADIDVHRLHQLYTRALVANGGQVHVSSKLDRAVRAGGVWTVNAGSICLQAPVIVNAAGAWAGPVGVLLGAGDLGLVAYRRSAALLDLPAEFVIEPWPLVIEAAETFYFKPDAGRLMLSPADETPCTPCDAVADDLDIAVAVDRFESMTCIDVKRVSHTWAGLRTFAPDRIPLIGFDPRVAGLFWLAGQGGVGVQTAPAVARLTAALVTNTGLPDDLVAAGVMPDVYSPGRISADRCARSVLA